MGITIRWNSRVIEFDAAFKDSAELFYVDHDAYDPAYLNQLFSQHLSTENGH